MPRRSIIGARAQLGAQDRRRAKWRIGAVAARPQTMQGIRTEQPVTVLLAKVWSGLRDAAAARHDRTAADNG